MKQASVSSADQSGGKSRIGPKRKGLSIKGRFGGVRQSLL
jgi:hypothetical protein